VPACPRLDSLPRTPLPGGIVLARAESGRARLLGLAWLAELPPHCALHLPRCRSVHTVGMRFPLDLVWLDGDGRPVRVDRAVAPWRLRTCLTARSVVEVGAGRADALLAALAAAP
jgi:uncharacterized membrane protein (UPF0127 family)